jgi:hypothetical protein
MIGCGSSTVEEIHMSENSIDEKNNKQDIFIDLGDSINLDYRAEEDIKSFKWYDNGKLISIDKSFVYKPSYIGDHELKLITLDENANREEHYIYINVKNNQNITSKEQDQKEENSKTVKPQKAKIIKPPKSISGVHINEVLAANINSAYDRDYYAFSDYIELKNYENRDIDLSGYTLSDDKKSWKFPKNIKIKANDYLIVWADKKNKSKKDLHTNFKLSQKKDSVIFKDNSGNIIDDISFKKIKGGVSINEVSGKIVYMNPTPNRKNSTLFSAQVFPDKPNSSLSSGFYNGSQLISLSSNDNSTIYYTTDGKTPTKNSKIYTKPIVINKSTVVKSRSYKKGFLDGEISTNSYILNFDTTLPVVSLSIDNKFLYDDMIGIYTIGKNGAYTNGCEVTNAGYKNYMQRWKRPVSVEYFDDKHERVFSFGSNIAISGQCSRNHPKKQLKIQLDDKYGVKSLEYKFYEEKGKQKIRDFRLRPGRKGFEASDILAAKIVADGNLNVDYQASKPIQMFLNGEYWGIYNIRERKGDEYLKSNYTDINKKKLDVLKPDEVKEGSKKDYEKLLDYITGSHSKIEKYNRVVNSVDTDNFIDYMSVMIYSANDDWIYSNNRCWKENTKGSKYRKWRWMLDDLDRGFQAELLYSDAFLLAKAQNEKYKNIKWKNLMSEVFKVLLTNQGFKSRFKARFSELLDTTFTPENLHKLIDEIEITRLNEMPKSAKFNYPNKFNKHLEDLRNFISKRAAIVKKQLASF